MTPVEARFGESAPLSLGVEEELMILDAATLLPSPSVALFVGDAPGGRLKTEMHASVVEANTGVCGSVAEAAEALAALRARAREIAAANGLAVAAGASHPLARPEELEIVQEPRYLEMVGRLGATARRQGVSGLHVHVGMPSGDDCVRVIEWVLPWLPVVLALSANSPYMGGEETGFMSARAPILAELPRSGAPPAFGSYTAWEAFVERLARIGVAADYTLLWWDVRPHPRFGTVEVRMPDQPTAPERTTAFVALLRGLCAAALDGDPRPPDPAIYAQNRWAAARFGPRAELVHPDRDELVPASELGRELLGLARVEGTVDPGWCEADRQLEIGRRDGLEAVCSDLVARS